jgi:class 3 adenylate cyclase
VSDFGLTKFKASLKNDDDAGQIGSVHWSAPEILAEANGVDFILTDVYAFGIILWELLTRDMPYYGLSPAAVAVAVLRDDLRPTVPADTSVALNSSAMTGATDYIDLMRNCWHRDPIIRPTFLEIMTRLSSLTGGETGTATNTSKSSSSSGSSTPGTTSMTQMNTNGSWSLPTHSVSGSNSGSSASSVDQKTGAVKPPDGAMAIVFTDVTRAASLWEFDSEAMLRAMVLHNELLRALLVKHHGYEVRFSGGGGGGKNGNNAAVGGGNSGEGSFCVAFGDAARAVEWCMEAQQALLGVEWPEALVAHPGAAEEWGDVDDRLIFKGLRVRMGVHFGEPRRLRDAVTRRVEYHGSVVNIAAHLTTITHGGQVRTHAHAHVVVSQLNTLFLVGAGDARGVRKVEGLRAGAGAEAVHQARPIRGRPFPRWCACRPPRVVCVVRSAHEW